MNSPNPVSEDVIISSTTDHRLSLKKMTIPRSGAEHDSTEPPEDGTKAKTFTDDSRRNSQCSGTQDITSGSVGEEVTISI